MQRPGNCSYPRPPAWPDAQETSKRRCLQPACAARAELAAFAFWEELLPFSDFLPTATIGWALVVTGTRTRLTRADWNR